MAHGGLQRPGNTSPHPSKAHHERSKSLELSHVQKKAKRNKRNESGSFTNLPPEIFQKVFDYAGLATIVRLASCSSRLQNYVYEECTNLWVEIDFGKVPVHHTAEMTDQSLQRLLQRVNACETTKVLSLRGCEYIIGSGLEPLRHSTVLQSIDLRLGGDHDVTVGPTGLDDAFVIGLLDSMISQTNSPTTAHASLSAVKFRKQTRNLEFSKAFDESISSFLIRLYQIQKIQVHGKNQNACTHCQDPDTAQFPDEHRNYDVPCTSCKDPHFVNCGSMLFCDPCGSPYCKQCRDIWWCALCQNSFCETCREVDFCAGCNACYCQSCRPTCLCDSCYAPYCDRCRNTYSCIKCNFSYCDECRKISFCETCGAPHCEKCKDEIVCNFCNDACCDKCNINCFECADCEVADCESCENTTFCEKRDKFFCGHCKKVTMCRCGFAFCDPVCGQTLLCGSCSREDCQQCRRGLECQQCNNYKCTNCNDIGYCENCFKFLCQQCGDISDCKVCDKYYCAECKGSFCESIHG